MKTLATLGLASLFVGSLVTGCASPSVSPSGGDDDGGGSTGGGSTGGGSTGGGSTGSDTGGGSTTPSLDGTGTYSVKSVYDISSNMPGTIGTIVNDFIDATNDPDDPTLWVLQLLVAQLPSEYQSYANTIVNLGAGYLNDQLLDWAPTFVTDIKTIGSDFGDIAQHFGINETYVVAGASGTYTATDTATGVHFTIGSVGEDFNFTDYGVDDIVDNDVSVAMDDSGAFTIGKHDLSIPYGTVMEIALNAGIIPLIDPSAGDLSTFLSDEINCAAVGTYVEQLVENETGIDLGSSLFSDACTAGLNEAASEINSELSSISSTALDFSLTQGLAKGVDTNGDGKIDELNLGKWTGTLDYSGEASAPLATATFTGTRL